MNKLRILVFAFFAAGLALFGRAAPGHAQPAVPPPAVLSGLVSAPGAHLTQYTIPLMPTNLALSASGDVWLTSFEDSAIGHLSTTALRFDSYGPIMGSPWGIRLDATGRIWFGVTNSGEDYVGVLHPATGEITLWRTGYATIFGIALDGATGDLWFVSRTPSAITRLSPEQNKAVSWSTQPYRELYDVTLDPAGKVWVTVQPDFREGLLRLDPATGELTAWELPVAHSRPARLFAESADSILLSEFGPAGNALAYFTPSTNLLEEYGLPATGAGPHGIAGSDGQVWAALRNGNGLARLNRAVQSPVVATKLTPVALAGTTSEPSVTRSTFTPAKTESIVSVATAALTPSSYGAFTLYDLPTGSGPFDVTAGGSPNEVWLTGFLGKYVGQVTLPWGVYLPLMSR